MQVIAHHEQHKEIVHHEAHEAHEVLAAWLSAYSPLRSTRLAVGPFA